jgi:CNT family concentrative nucleoside transporter
MTPAAPVRTGTPPLWRAGIFASVVVVTAAAYLLDGAIGSRGRAVLGVLAFLGVACGFSANVRAINWRTVASGLGLQLVLALLILQVPVVRSGFEAVGGAIQKFLDFTDAGAKFVFGPLSDPVAPPPPAEAAVFGGAAYGHRLDTAPPPRPFIFAFKALPAVVFVSSFFTVLYYLGVLQLIVRTLATLVVWVMGTSGAETLSAVANVFMGQTEAPLIVKPYVERMTRSELLALMIGGMATISGGVMVAYIAMGADPVAILATSVMAAPAGLYLSKILIPEEEEPETRGVVRDEPACPDANVFDAAARGASEGMTLVLNIAAMLIAFIAFIALGNHVLKKIDPDWSLQAGFAKGFGPVAVLMGVPTEDVPKVAELLGTKLVLNEFVAYTVLTDKYRDMNRRSFDLSVFALTGFANFASVGIQLGGIGAMAPNRRADLAKLGMRALLGGFLATLINAAVAGLLM